MARAHNVYLVVWCDYDGHEVLGAFTVKHEMITWLKAQEPKRLVGCEVLRMPDGRTGESHTYTIEELLGA